MPAPTTGEFLTDQTADTSPTVDAILYAVTDVGGTPTPVKVTLPNLFAENGMEIGLGRPALSGNAVAVGVEDSGTATVLYPVSLRRSSSGTPATGIGTGLQFITETSTDNDEIGAVIESVATNVFAASEAFDLVFKTMTGGAAATEAGRFKNDNALALQGGINLLDSNKVILGTGNDAELYYDGTNLIINPKAVGSGVVSVSGDVGVGAAPAASQGLALVNTAKFFNPGSKTTTQRDAISSPQDGDELFNSTTGAHESYDAFLGSFV